MASLNKITFTVTVDEINLLREVVKEAIDQRQAAAKNLREVGAIAKGDPTWMKYGQEILLLEAIQRGLS